MSDLIERHGVNQPTPVLLCQAAFTGTHRINPSVVVCLAALAHFGLRGTNPANYAAHDAMGARQGSKCSTVAYQPERDAACSAACSNIARRGVTWRCAVGGDFGMSGHG